MLNFSGGYFSDYQQFIKKRKSASIQQSPRSAFLGDCRAEWSPPHPYPTTPTTNGALQTVLIVRRIVVHITVVIVLTKYLRGAICSRHAKFGMDCLDIEVARLDSI